MKIFDFHYAQDDKLEAQRQRQRAVGAVYEAIMTNLFAEWKAEQFLEERLGE